MCVFQSGIPPPTPGTLGVSTIVFGTEREREREKPELLFSSAQIPPEHSKGIKTKKKKQREKESEINPHACLMNNLNEEMKQFEVDTRKRIRPDTIRSAYTMSSLSRAV